MELDPVFIRALRLLHSTSKESGMQLKAMLDESIRMKKNPGSAPLKMTAVPAPQGRESHVKETTDRYFNLIHSRCLKTHNFVIYKTLCIVSTNLFFFSEKT